MHTGSDEIFRRKQVVQWQSTLQTHTHVDLPNGVQVEVEADTLLWSTSKTPPRPFTASGGWGSSDNHPCPSVMSLLLSWPNGMFKTRCLRLAKVSRALTGRMTAGLCFEMGNSPHSDHVLHEWKAWRRPPSTTPATTSHNISTDCAWYGGRGGASATMEKRNCWCALRNLCSSKPPDDITLFPKWCPQACSFKYTNHYWHLCEYFSQKALMECLEILTSHIKLPPLHGNCKVSLPGPLDELWLEEHRGLQKGIF